MLREWARVVRSQNSCLMENDLQFGRVEGSGTVVGAAARLVVLVPRAACLP